MALTGLLLASPPAVRAQFAPPPADSQVRGMRTIRIRGSATPEQILQLLRPGDVRNMRIGPEAPVSQQPFEPLPPDAQQRLTQARELRLNAQLEPARRELTSLLATVPHHPLVLEELAEVELARSNWSGVERMARQERSPHRDSLLLARPLATALERLGKPKDAAQVAVEAWAASRQSWWAPDALERLAPTDPAVREALRAALPRVPSRTDMALELAGLDWKSGAGPEAMRTLTALDGPERRPPLRVSFAEQLLQNAVGRDSSGAADALLAVGEDARMDAVFRIPAIQTAWRVLVGRRGEVAAAPRVSAALQGIPLARWDSEFLMDLARALRRGGHTAEARTLLGQSGPQIDAGSAALERALTELRDGPPEKALPALQGVADASPEGAFRYAEALFFSGMSDSAMTLYKLVSQDASGAWTGAALERLFLIEDANPAAALPAIGRMAWQQWRGEPRNAMALAESLVRVLPPGPTWSWAGVELSRLREGSGDVKGALAAVMDIAEKQPGDRLASVARQRAGDLYLDKLHDERAAVAQYEECLARYPKAWNAAEVRRRLDTLRRERRF